MRVSRLRPAAALLAALAAALVTGVPAGAAEPDGSDAGFKELETNYKKLAKNHDDAANIQRRTLILQCFDFRTLKSCKKLLKDAYGDESSPDNRIAIVQVLAATGDPKDLDLLLTAFKKEKAAGPVLAVTQGLSFTDPATSAVIAPYAVSLAGKQKGEIVRALVEGVGLLGESTAAAPLTALAGKLTRPDEFERLIAAGACGREAARDVLERTSVSPDPDFRLAAALGLAATGGPGQAPPASTATALMNLCADHDARVVRVAAAALGKMKHKDAVKPLAEAMKGTDLRTRESLREALKAITSRDAAYDTDAWLKDGGTAAAPKLPEFAGLPLPSNRVALVLDLSRSMDWNARLAKAQEVLRACLASLPEDALFGVIAAGRSPIAFSERLASGAAARAQADQFISEQKTAGGCDLQEALKHVKDLWPEVDSIVLATDSSPRGEGPDDTPYEVIYKFRRDTRLRPIHVYSAFTAPGGRYPESEIDANEYEYRKTSLQELAEMTGGGFKALE